MYRYCCSSGLEVSAFGSAYHAMQTLNRTMAAVHIQPYRCVALVLLIMLSVAQVDFVMSIQLNNPRGPLKGKCPVCRDIVKDFHNVSINIAFNLLGLNFPL